MYIKQKLLGTAIDGPSEISDSDYCKLNVFKRKFYKKKEEQSSSFIGRSTPSYREDDNTSSRYVAGYDPYYFDTPSRDDNVSPSHTNEDTFSGFGGGSGGGAGASGSWDDTPSHNSSNDYDNSSSNDSYSSDSSSSDSGSSDSGGGDSGGSD